MRIDSEGSSLTCPDRGYLTPHMHPSTTRIDPPATQTPLGGEWKTLDFTCDQAAEAFAGAVLVCADDQRIVDVVISEGYQAVLTGTHHQSGTDGIAEAVAGRDEGISLSMSRGTSRKLSLRDSQHRIRLIDGQLIPPMATLATTGDGELDQLAAGCGQLYIAPEWRRCVTHCRQIAQSPAAADCNHRGYAIAAFASTCHCPRWHGTVETRFFAPSGSNNRHRGWTTAPALMTANTTHTVAASPR